MMISLIHIAHADGLIPCKGSACTTEDFYTLIANIVRFGLDFAVMIAVVAILWGGFLILISAGDPGRQSQGKDAIKAAVVGLIIVLSAWLIVNTLISVFTTCSGWNAFGGIRC